METFSLKPTTTATAGRLFAGAVRRVLAAWLIGFALVLAWVLGTDPNFLWSATFVSIASGVVAVVALGPIAWLAKSPGEAVFADESSSQFESIASRPANGSAVADANWAHLASALMSGVILRLFGTVALFLLCRYQMGQQSGVIAAWVAGWYLWLASVEVYSLAKSVPAPLTK